MIQLLSCKIFSISVALLAVLLLSPTDIAITFIVMGQAHFALVYLYQYKAGKITKTYIVWYILLLTSLFIITDNLDSDFPMKFFTGMYFIMHFLFDEIKLFHKAPSIFTTLESIPITILFVGYFMHDEFKADISMFVYTALAFIVLYMLCMTFLTSYSVNIISVYFTLGSIALIYVLSSGINVYPVQVLFGFIVLIHYINWYIHYYFKVAHDKLITKQYLRNIILINLLVVVTYLIYVELDYDWTDEIFDIWFLSENFWIWTIMHITFSTRISDFKAAIKVNDSKNSNRGVIWVR